MPAWITAYIATPPSEEDLAATFDALRGRSDGTEHPVEIVRQRWGWQVSLAPDTRPLEASVWEEPARVAVEIEEALEDLSDIAPENEAPLIEQLERTRVVIGVEMGWTQVQTFAGEVALELASALARDFDGVLRDAQDHWRAHDTQTLIYL